ncbi:MAG: DUF3109 family protein [Paludibacteraceae bacterium]|nr:DUF3109 family protein [Paludibacteraceae bacterium]
MIQIDDTIISTDLFDTRFCCDLSVCKGECCVEGDSGAPLEQAELAKLEEVLPVVWDDLSEKSKAVIERQGVSYVDVEGDLVTSIVGQGECVFSRFEEDGTCICAIEKAYREGRVGFYKPISCHLYPVRLETLRNGTVALNVHRWKVCRCAFAKGQEENVPLYVFLKEPLIRRFGKDWYEKVEIAAEELKKMEDRG